MTYHMKHAVPMNRVFHIDSQKLFPEKLYDVVNDDYLLRWTDGGTWVSVVDEKTFENEVMRRYPKFLQIPSFMNLRRLFREYSFDWRVNEETSLYEFHHPCFQKGKPQLLCQIMTRRKSSGPSSGRKRKAYVKKCSPPENKECLPAECRQGKPGYQSRLFSSLQPSNEASPACLDKNGTTTTQQIVADSTSSFTALHENAQAHESNQQAPKVKKDFSELKNTFIRNENDGNSFHGALPPEVWSHTPLPTCPSAIQQVHGDFKQWGNVYQTLQHPPVYPQNANYPQGDNGERLNGQNPQQGGQNGENHYNMGWGQCMPFYYPYPPNYSKENYSNGNSNPEQTRPHAGEGSGDSRQPNEPSPNHQPTGPYWGLPYGMPWYPNGNYIEKNSCHDQAYQNYYSGDREGRYQQNNCDGTVQ